jgi:glycerol-3-phosphate dehydrogenase subunit C
LLRPRRRLGVREANFATAIKTGRPVARKALEADKRYLVSECPLAGPHIAQGMERLVSDGEGVPVPGSTLHPIELFALAYGIDVRRAE